jgi:hypothetical protein
MSYYEVSGLWSHVANLRRREGDREGAARALLAARYSGPIRRARAPRPREFRWTGTVHYLTNESTLRRGSASMVHDACNGSAPNSQSTITLSKVNCGNCRRTGIFLEALAKEEESLSA